jgi:hypothetical protein
VVIAEVELARWPHARNDALILTWLGRHHATLADLKPERGDQDVLQNCDRAAD